MEQLKTSLHVTEQEFLLDLQCQYHFWIVTVLKLIYMDYMKYSERILHGYSLLKYL